MPSQPALPRGEKTREALLEAATEVFGRDGYHAASTRAIARAADMNQALIGYHFGGKQGLYLAVFKACDDDLRAQLQSLLLELQERLQGSVFRGPGAREAAVAGVEQLLVAVFRIIVDPSRASMARLLMREQQDPTEAINILYTGTFGEVLKIVGALVSRASGEPEASEEVRLRTLMCLGQLVIFVAGRGTTRRQMGWERLGTRELAVIEAQFRENLRRLFPFEESAYE